MTITAANHRVQKVDNEQPLWEVSPGGLRVCGRLAHDTAGDLWRSFSLPVALDGTVVLDASRVTECDSAGLALLVMIYGRVLAAGARFAVSGLPPETMALYESMLLGRVEAPARKLPTPFFESVGRFVANSFNEALALLALFAIVAGLTGGFVVIYSLGYSFEAYVSHVMQFSRPHDLYGTLIKALVFGALVGGVGCHCGLQTGRSADAVGRSTTNAVVSAIVAVAIADGLFAVVFYCLGI